MEKIFKKILNDGTIEYRNETDLLHREDGPAVILPDGTKKWYEYDVLHREDGPAVIYPDENVEYWIDDEQLTKDKFYNKSLDTDPLNNYKTHLESLLKQIPNIINKDTFTFSIATIDGITKDTVSPLKSSNLFKYYLFTLLSDDFDEFIDIVEEGFEPYGGYEIIITNNNIKIKEIPNEEDWYWFDNKERDKELYKSILQLDSELQDYELFINEKNNINKLYTSINEFKKYLYNKNNI